MTLKPEWLDEALAGHPVLLRSKQKAYVRHCEEELPVIYKIFGYKLLDDGSPRPMAWLLNGRRSKVQETPDDIVGLYISFDYWDVLPDEAKFIAKDGDGSWAWYTSEPKLNTTSGWWDLETDKGYSQGISGLKESVLPGLDWRNSLIARPEEAK